MKISIAKFPKREKKKARSTQAAAKPPPRKRGRKKKIPEDLIPIIAERDRQLSEDPDLAVVLQRELDKQNLWLAEMKQTEQEIMNGRPPSIPKQLWLELQDGWDPVSIDCDLPPPTDPKLLQKINAAQARHNKHRKKIGRLFQQKLKRLDALRRAGGETQKSNWEEIGSTVVKKNRGLLVLSKDSSVAKKIFAEWYEIPAGKHLASESRRLKNRGIHGVSRRNVRTLTAWVKKYRPTWKST